MSAEGKPTVDDDDSVSMLEVLAEESRMQEDASAVLGGSDDQECSYTKGYVKRQALYACSTCATTELAGICLACSYRCHDGHDLYELYTKRHFRCDCGNSKFIDVTCNLQPTKDEMNEENQYNQNFRGAYCTCARPYPDPDDEIEDDMIQCVVCEDWYHGRHLGADLPENDSYQEMICGGCMAKHPFLWAYQVSSSAEKVKKESDKSGEEKIDIGGGEGETSRPAHNGSGSADKRSTTAEAENSSKSVKEEPDENDHDKKVAAQSDSPLWHVHAEVEPVRSASGKEAAENGADPGKSTKRRRDCFFPTAESSSAGTSTSTAVESELPPKRARASEEGSSSSSNGSEGGCFLKELQKRQVVENDCATFWTEGWREKLCTCSVCISMYRKECVEFLLDVEDTISAYERGGSTNLSGISDMEILSGMSHTQKIEMINGFSDMKTELREFLRGFAESRRVVRSSDIKEFFDRLKKRKKERLAASDVQHFCK